MKNDKDLKKWWPAAIAVVLVLVAIIVIPNINFGFDDSTRLRIDNWREALPSVPESTRIRVEEVLRNQVSVNLDGNVPSSGAKIRVGSQKTIEANGGLVLGDFIVDIPDIQQSYIIQYFYGNDSGSTYVGINNGQEFEESASVAAYCITNQEDIIYPDFACRDGSVLSNSDTSISIFYVSFLSSQAEISVDGKEAALYMDYDSYGSPRLNVVVDNCGDSSIIKEAKEAARTWVENAGFDPDVFVYRAPLKYDYCAVK